MQKDPFLLVSLEESESKALAQVMSNDTARKILDYLSKNDSATESDVAKDLKVPLSTVHYNLQALVKANLAQTEEFHYSKKGKEILHYSLANKIIIIAPKNANTQSFKDKLKGLLPIGLISVAAAGIIEVLQVIRNMQAQSSLESFSAVQPMAFSATEGAAVPAAKMAVQSVAADSTNLAVQTSVQSSLFSTGDYLALWFLAGSLFTILVLTIWYYFSSKKK